MEAHCKHLGAHIGHGGKVVGDCVECPFHGWRWGPDGTNRYIPYQPDRPNRGLHAARVPGQGAVRLRVRLASPARHGTAVGDAGHLHVVPPVRDRPEGLLPALSGVLPARRARTGAPADRRRERPRQRALPVRPPRHGDPEAAGLEHRRPGVALPDRLAGRRQRRSRRDGAADPQQHVRSRRRHQRVRGPVEPPADLRLHTGRRRGTRTCSIRSGSRGCPATSPTCRRTPCASASRSSSSVTVWDDLDIWRYQKYVEHPALSRVDAKPYMALRKWATQFYDVAAASTVTAREARTRRPRRRPPTPRSSPRSARAR